MNRWLAILLIVSLLACPVRCAYASSCQHRTADRQTSAACRCCRHKSPSHQKTQKHDSPDQEKSCPTCMCEGAVVHAKTIDLENILQISAEFQDSFCVLDEASLGIRRVDRVGLFKDDVFLIAGRTQRIALHSLQL